MGMPAEGKIHPVFFQLRKFRRLMLEYDHRFFRIRIPQQLLRCFPVGGSVPGLFSVDPSCDLDISVRNGHSLIVQHRKAAVFTELLHLPGPESLGDRRDRESPEKRLLHIVVSIYGIYAFLRFELPEGGCIFVRVPQSFIGAGENIPGNHHRIRFRFVDPVHHFFDGGEMRIHAEMKIRDQHDIQIRPVPRAFIHRHVQLRHDGILGVNHPIGKKPEAADQADQKDSRQMQPSRTLPLDQQYDLPQQGETDQKNTEIDHKAKPDIPGALQPVFQIAVGQKCARQGEDCKDHKQQDADHMQNVISSVKRTPPEQQKHDELPYQINPHRIQWIHYKVPSFPLNCSFLRSVCSVRTA